VPATLFSQQQESVKANVPRGKRIIRSKNSNKKIRPETLKRTQPNPFLIFSNKSSQDLPPGIT
jgi:hypothetical protein